MAGGPGTKPALHPLTADDRGSLILIVAYGWIFIAAIVTLIRFGLAWNRKLRFKVDDGTFVVGVTLAAASSACFHLAVNGGLGKRMHEVPPPDLDQYYKAMYAGELLSIAAMASAKTSVVLLSDRVAPRETRPYNVMLGLVGLWGLFAIFAIAFQSGLPEPWVFAPDHSPTKGALYYPIIVLNILTDGLLAVWILPTVWNLFMNTGKRVTVACLFGSRLIVCSFAIVQLTSVARHIRNPDVTYEAFGRVLWGLCVMHLSVLQAAVPRTNRFIAALQNTHMTTLLTDFELAPPNGPRPAPPKEESRTTEAGPTASDDAYTRQRSESNPRSRSHSHSPSRSYRSQQPLVGFPLQLIPSVAQGFSTYIISNQSSSEGGKKQKRSANKYDWNDWRKYLHRRSNKDDDMNISNMFSWRSRTSIGQEQIVQTREVTQEVEVVSPTQSRWVLSKPRRLDRDRM